MPKIKLAELESLIHRVNVGGLTPDPERTVVMLEACLTAIRAAKKVKAMIDAEYAGATVPESEGDAAVGKLTAALAEFDEEASDEQG